MDTFDVIRSRRSVGRLVEPAPTREELQAIIEAAVFAPDHKELRPWRFILLRGANKNALGDKLVDALLKREPGATEGQVEKERSKLGRAPLVIVVVCKRLEAKIPFEELFAACAAATQNLLLAATDLGYGTIWRTGGMAYDSNVKRALGLDDQDAIVGFVYVGTPSPTAEKLAPKTANLDEVVIGGFAGNS